jgi:haloalkane dehalogenase
MPFDRRAIEVGGRTLHFVDHGDGPPVLLVHGNPTWSFLWRKIIRGLAGFRVIAPDLLGFGLSDKPRSVAFHTVDAHVEHLRALIDALDLDRWIVVGQDWGGPLSCGVARHLDDRGRLHGMVLANTAVLPARRPVRATGFHRFSHLPLLSEAAFVGLGFPIPVMARTQHDPSSIGAPELRGYAWPFRRLRDRVGPLALARMVPHCDTHPSLPALDAIGRWVEGWRGPAALVWGTADPILGRGARRLSAAWPQAELVETAAGHFLQEEVPELLVDAIRRVRAA